MPRIPLTQMQFVRIYHLYLAKVSRKGRTKAEVDEIITWLTGYSLGQLAQMLSKAVDVETFFSMAPNLNPHRHLITGRICGVRIEEITDPLMQDIRYLDKLIDELAKGKSMDKILRKPK